jgi:hypothetical protein
MQTPKPVHPTPDEWTDARMTLLELSRTHRAKIDAELKRRRDRNIEEFLERRG